MQQSGRRLEAVAAYEAALAIDDRHAMLHYRLGNCLFALGKYAEANAALCRAVDEDVCPLRMTSDLDEALKRVVSRTGVPVVDMQELLSQHCLAEFGHPVLGREYFLDHVHPTISGHGQLAVALADRLREERILPGTLRWSDADLAEVKRQVNEGVDDRLRARGEANLARVLFWAGKVDEAGPLALKCHETEDDPRILLIAGVYLHRQGETRQALDLLRRARRMSPTDVRIEKALEAIGNNRPTSDT
jgi:tetratricopeptide (TPR) repeat protein